MRPSRLWVVNEYPAEKVVRLVLKDPFTGRALVMQTMAIRGTTATVFGTMRQPWHSWIRVLIFYRLTKNRARTLFLRRFQNLARARGVTRLRGSVPARVWDGSYKHWSGFTEYGRAWKYGVEMVLIQKVGF